MSRSAPHPAADRAHWPWPRQSPYPSRLLQARIAWLVHDHGDIESMNAVFTLRARLVEAGVEPGPNLGPAVRAAAELGLVKLEPRADGARRLAAIRAVPAAALPPNPWPAPEPKPAPAPEPAPALRLAPTPEPLPEPVAAPEMATEAPLELPQGRWADLSREQRLLAIMDLAGAALLDHLTDVPPAPTADALERLADALADNARLRNDLDAERRRRRDAEAATESGAKALRAERKRAQLVQANLDAIVTGLAKGPAAGPSEVARLMQERPVAR